MILMGRMGLMVLMVYLDHLDLQVQQGLLDKTECMVFLVLLVDLKEIGDVEVKMVHKVLKARLEQV